MFRTRQRRWFYTIGRVQLTMPGVTVAPQYGVTIHP